MLLQNSFFHFLLTAERYFNMYFFKANFIYFFYALLLISFSLSISMGENLQVLFFLSGLLLLAIPFVKKSVPEKKEKEKVKIEEDTSMIAPVPQTYDDKLSSLDELFRRSKNYKNSKNYIEALKFVIKIKNVAPFNAWLLREQNLDITYVASANEWARKFNRAIKPKARAYVIMNHTPVGFVYDISDTEGDELPKDLQSHFRAEGKLDDEIIKNIINCCSKKKIDVIFDNTLRESQAGRASHDKFNNTRKIYINKEHPKEVKFSTLCHEIAHLMLGHLGEFSDCQCKDRKDLDLATREIEAESVSWLVCDRLGIKTDADRYLNHHLEDNVTALQDISINNILITAGRIEAMALKKECKVKKIKATRTQGTLL